MPPKILFHSLVCVVLLLTSVIATSNQNAKAATITVTTEQDGAVGSVPGCTLREALESVNLQRLVGGCGNSDGAFGTNDQIRFAANVTTVTLAPENLVSNVALQVSRAVTIRGNGSQITSISGAKTNLILIRNSSNFFQLRSVRLRDAETGLENMSHARASLISVRFSGHSRRAILNRGQMSIYGSKIDNNPGGRIANANDVPVATAVPGTNDPSVDEFPARLEILLSVIKLNGPTPCAGIFNGGLPITNSPIFGQASRPAGTLTLRRSRITDNTAGEFDGGGICNFSDASITQSEISRNDAYRGGGLALGWEPQITPIGGPPPALVVPNTTLENSTISTNFATTTGGAIFINTTGDNLKISYCTIAYNVAGGSNINDAGGLAHAGGPLTARFDANALMLNRTQGRGNPNCTQLTLDGGYNFWPRRPVLSISVPPPPESEPCVLTGPNNITIGTAQLGPLRANGDTTSSHRPPSNSVMVDRVPVASGFCGRIDQRDRSRPQNGNNDKINGCDIGAIELP